MPIRADQGEGTLIDTETGEEQTQRWLKQGVKDGDITLGGKYLKMSTLMLCNRPMRSTVQCGERSAGEKVSEVGWLQIQQ